MMMAQKKILALHDLAGFGRSSLVPITGVLCAMGYQCVPMPTAVYSSHTAIGRYVVRDLSDMLAPAMAQYSVLGLRFDAVYSGFLNSAEQIDSVILAARTLKVRKGGLTMIDPVMGDNGVIYRTYSAELCERMSELCRLADVITPNVTEAAILLGRDPSDAPQSEMEVCDWARQLARRYETAVVVTGVEVERDNVGVACFVEGEASLLENAKLNAYYPGTGDIFTSVLLGEMLRGKPLVASAKRAADFVSDCIRYTESQGAEPLWGVQFEPMLRTLME